MCKAWNLKKGAVVCSTHDDDKKGTRYGHGILVGPHAYSVNSANKDHIHIWNPWGRDINLDRLHVVKALGFGKYTYQSGHSDYYGDDPTDGHIVLSWRDFKTHFQCFTMRDEDLK